MQQFDVTEFHKELTAAEQIVLMVMNGANVTVLNGANVTIKTGKTFDELYAEVGKLLFELTDDKKNVRLSYGGYKLTVSPADAHDFVAGCEGAVLVALDGLKRKGLAAVLPNLVLVS